MSWASLHGTAEPVLAASPAESDRFGLSCARLEVADGARGALPLVLSALADPGPDLVALRYPARHVGWFAQLREAGRELLLADTLVYWRLDVGSGRRTTGEGLVVGTEDHPDADEVGRFVAEVFDGYGNHYAADPLLDPAAALAGYQEWAVRSASAGAVVVRRDGELLALATTSVGEDHVEIELAGVAPAHQRQGVYAALLGACEARAASVGVRRVVISTQAHNAHVQRAWARYGFEPVSAFTTVHALRPGLLGSPAAYRGDGPAT